MADYIAKEDASHITLEDSSGALLLETSGDALPPEPQIVTVAVKTASTW